MQPDRIYNDFVLKFANVNGSGSASANLLCAKTLFRMGIPVAAKNIFPIEHSGPADLVRNPRLGRGVSGPARRHRHHGGDEPSVLRTGRGRRLARRGADL